MKFFIQPTYDVAIEWFQNNHQLHIYFFGTIGEEMLNDLRDLEKTCLGIRIHAIKYNAIGMLVEAEEEVGVLASEYLLNYSPIYEGQQVVDLLKTYFELDKELRVSIIKMDDGEDPEQMYSTEPVKV